jgi:hypothetical protein
LYALVQIHSNKYTAAVSPINGLTTISTQPGLPLTGQIATLFCLVLQSAAACFFTHEFLSFVFLYATAFFEKAPLPVSLSHSFFHHVLPLPSHLSL